jgi:hypothetical protein
MIRSPDNEASAVGMIMNFVTLFITPNNSNINPKLLGQILVRSISVTFS